MFTTLKRRIKNEKGLSLVELLAVIVILAIVAAIAIPAIGNIINNQRDKAILSDASSLLSGAKIAIVDGSCGAPSGSGAAALITCEKAVLEDVFEGKLVTGDQVTYNPSTKVYTVTYSKLANIKNTGKFTVAAVSGEDIGFTPSASNTTITEVSLNKAMGK